MTEHSSDPSNHVVIAGGGVAALEALIGLRDLAGDRVRITLVAPEPDFVYRPMSVAEPFDLGTARHYPLNSIASDFGARLVRGAVVSVDAAERRLACRSGLTLSYDVLVLAPGARMLPVFEEAITFGQPGAGAAMRGVLTELDEGVVSSVAFVVPTLVGWGLPLYELALMTGARVRSQNIANARISLITPEDRPLGVFGDAASATVARLLGAAGVEFMGSISADDRGGHALFDQAGRPLPYDRVVTLPLIRGPQLEGVPLERDNGFIPVDRHGRVADVRDVYAAGDATDFPVKQGGLATQQADTVAHHIALRYGAPVALAPFRPRLRGMLFTGAESHYLRSGVWQTGDEGSVSAQPLWLPATKIAGRYLAPYLSAADEAEATERPSRAFTDVDIAVGDVDRPSAPVQRAGEPAHVGQRNAGSGQAT